MSTSENKFRLHHETSDSRFSYVNTFIYIFFYFHIFSSILYYLIMELSNKNMKREATACASLVSSTCDSRVFHPLLFSHFLHNFQPRMHLLRRNWEVGSDFLHQFPKKNELYVILVYWLERPSKNRLNNASAILWLANRTDKFLVQKWSSAMWVKRNSRFRGYSRIFSELLDGYFYENSTKNSIIFWLSLIND